MELNPVRHRKCDEGFTLKRIRVTVTGRVQGVGFRPLVYRYATRLGLVGWVANTSTGVIIEVEGDPPKIERFITLLKTEPPPQAEITNIDITSLPLKHEREFKILPSITQAHVKTQVSPDIATCGDCLRELFDPNDRRYLYPFINCTNCGPRFTIVKDIPYDRHNTTMAKFKMCHACQSEYDDPLTRRFHAQPNACPVCGPQVTLIQPSNPNLCVRGVEAIKQTIQLLKAGKIVAIKGLGGFHLACDATNELAVKVLRGRKYREDKPFALMAKDLSTIRKYCEVSPEEEQLLRSPKAPIVLLRRRSDPVVPKIADSVAPNNRYLGFMLPYTPLHHLLFHNSPLTVLVMTSGNISDEPIAYENDDAITRLRGVAEYFLIHDRDIHVRCDDSVTRIFAPTGKEFIIRRSRGYVPAPISVPVEFTHTILACGAELKNTFALAHEAEVIMSHHIGDLENLETLTAFTTGVEHFKKLFDIEPQLIAYDLHPDYLSTKYAYELYNKAPQAYRLVPVQHHHAHIASCMADNMLDNHKVIGVAFDGTGLGTDGTLWGGEFLLADYGGFKRVAHFRYVPLVGGEQAIKQPWRIAMAYLYQIYGDDMLALEIDFVQRMERSKYKVLKNMIDKGINSPLSSSVGRLFDAVASLIGVRDTINYEGQAAIELEMIASEADNIRVMSYEYGVDDRTDVWVIDSSPIITGVVTDLQRKVPVDVIAGKFHSTVAKIILHVCEKIRTRYGVNEVALSGGVFQNMLLLGQVFKLLTDAGFRVYIHSRVPTNDGGIALGQVMVANFQKKEV